MKKLLTIVSVFAVSIMLLTLTACVSTNKDKVKQKYEDAGYIVTAKTVDTSDVEWILFGTKLTDSVTITCYKSNEEASNAYTNATKNLTDEQKKCILKSGKVLVIATSEEAAKIAK